MSTTTLGAPSLQTDPFTDPPQRSIFISLSVKLVLGFTVVFTLLFVGLGYYVYRIETDSALDDIQTSLTNTLTGTLAGIDGDEFAALVQDGQPNAAGLSDDPRFWAQVSWLAKVRGLDPLAYPYTYISAPDRDGQPTNVNIVDSYVVATGQASEGGGFKAPWVAEASPESRGGLGQLTYQLTPYKNVYGTWVSAFAPIRDSSGSVVGALGVDYRADTVAQRQENIRSRLIPAFFVSYLVLLVLVLLLSGALLDPLRRFTRAARQIAMGNYDERAMALKAPPRIDDEISTLTRVFGVMVAKVREREQALAQKLERLTIQIDEAKRQQDVRQIVETDFFQTLQDRAADMRRRKRAHETKPPPASPR